MEGIKERAAGGGREGGGEVGGYVEREAGGGGVFHEGRTAVEGWGGKGRGGVFEDRNAVTGKLGRRREG